MKTAVKKKKTSCSNYSVQVELILC